MKFLLLAIILGGVVWWWLQRKAARARASAPSPAQETPARPIERFVTCAHCSLKVPESEAVAADGVFYCSEAHRSLGPRA